MEEEIDLDVIKATQVSLGKYIKRPPLSEKLLKKPPFRFLHDIITTVLKTTGFFEGLYDENELISENVKDRESKISFLNKAITILSSTTGKSLLAKPSKIVAGQEPIKTNELLQCLASALDNNLSSDEAVKKYKENTKKTSKDRLEQKTKEPNKLKKKGQDPKKSENLKNHKTESSEIINIKKDKEKSNDNIKKKGNGPVKNDLRIKDTPVKLIPKKVTSETKLQSQSKVRSTLTVESSKQVNHEGIESTDENHTKDITCEESTNNTEIIEVHTGGEDNITHSTAEVDITSTPSEITADVDSHKLIQDNSNDNKKCIQEEPNENIVNARKNSLHINENLIHETQLSSMIENNHVNGSESLIIPSVQPDLEKNVCLSTPKKNDSNIARSASVRPSSSRPGAPRPKEKFENVMPDTDSHLLGKVNIITEHTQNEEDDDSSLIITEQQEGTLIMSKENHQNLTESLNDHGHLVQQILDSQKEFSQVTGKTEIEWQLGAQKAKAAQHKEVELLRYNIQALTRVTNPLGKLLDHIQEDVEVMRQELQQWSNIYEEVSKEISKQKALSEHSLHPLNTKLKQLELDIQEKNEKINDVKVLIYKNSSRIEKLLSNGNVQ
ncbi:TRAF3-interacting protein 1 [Manduca sexta]|uniref:TRAF3-interacting protein 1 n=1 Tax=Manduca sexta TaxID=7130 RepID=UPI0018901ACC|nr:TRAF3-interacting protein 1 [Manduca sexta]